MGAGVTQKVWHRPNLANLLVSAPQAPHRHLGLRAESVLPRIHGKVPRHNAALDRFVVPKTVIYTVCPVVAGLQYVGAWIPRYVSTVRPQL